MMVEIDCISRLRRLVAAAAAAVVAVVVEVVAGSIGGDGGAEPAAEYLCSSSSYEQVDRERLLVFKIGG